MDRRKVDLFPFPWVSQHPSNGNRHVVIEIPTMGFQDLCLVHQLVYWNLLSELFQHSVVAPAVEADHMRMKHLPGASQNHWAVESVVPEGAVAPVSALALAEAAAHPPVAVPSHIRSPLAIRHGHKAAARRTGCSTS